MKYIFINVKFWLGCINIYDIGKHYLFIFYFRKNMTEVGIAEYFSMAEDIGIIATLFVTLYFSRKQMQELSMDIKTKIINDLDERIRGLTQIGVEKPELIKAINNVEKCSVA